VTTRKNVLVGLFYVNLFTHCDNRCLLRPAPDWGTGVAKILQGLEARWSYQPSALAYFAFYSTTTWKRSESHQGASWMSNRTLLLWTVLWIAGLAAAVFAAEVDLPDPAARANQTALAAQQALQAATQGIFSVQGTISKIDHNTGQVEVKSSQGISTLSLAPEAVKELKVGQTVIVELVPRHE
jgi:hypothetical protein